MNSLSSPPTQYVYSALLVRLKNAVYKELFRLLEQGRIGSVDTPLHVQKEPVSFIRMAQRKWEDRLKIAINKLCTDNNVVLSKCVSQSETCHLYPEMTSL